MVSNLNRYENDLSKLVDLGKLMDLDLQIRSTEREGKLDKQQAELKKKVDGIFESGYQRWYTESLTVIRQLLPDRLPEFETLYKGEGRRKDINAMTYTIQDWLKGIQAVPHTYTGKKPFDDFATMGMRFRTQLQILKSIEARFESSLFDIKQLTKADLFDSELDSARELLENGFLRGAGAIAGVVLEKHLSEVCTNHKVTIRKKNPTISDYNDVLKKEEVIDVPNWRFVQRLGDLRNLCTHKKKREPTESEVAELIDGTDKVIKTLF